MEEGTVAFYNPSEGYGFIDSEAHRDVFFHVQDVSDFEPTEGQTLQLEVDETDEGPIATDIEAV